MKHALHTLLATSSMLFLASCSYQPLYAPQGATLASRIQVGEVAMERTETQNVGMRRPAQLLSQRLRQDFPQSGPDMDTLAVYVREDAAPLALRRTALTEREQLTLTARVVLTDAAGQKLFQTEVANTTAYNVETTPYATESGKTYARETAVRNIATEIVRRLSLFVR